MLSEQPGPAYTAATSVDGAPARNTEKNRKQRAKKKEAKAKAKATQTQTQDDSRVAELEQEVARYKEELRRKKTELQRYIDCYNKDQDPSCQILTERPMTERQKLGCQNGAIVGKRYICGNMLGTGEDGRVFKALAIDGDHISGVVAVKQVIDSQNKTKKDYLMKEIKFLRECDHKNIIRFVDKFTHNDSDHVVLEYLEGGSIAKHIREFGALPDALAKRYTAQILDGLDHLHRVGVVHRDIRGENALLSKNGEVKLTDFGRITKIVKHAGIEGTPHWMAPEILAFCNSCDALEKDKEDQDTDSQTTACDIWSVACTVVEMVTKFPPYLDPSDPENVYHADPRELVKRLYAQSQTVEHPPLPDGTQELRAFLKDCFTKSPKKRPTAEKLLECSWFGGLRVSCSNDGPSIDRVESFVSTRSEPSIRHVGVLNADGRFNNVKCFDSIDSATKGVHWLSVQNGTYMELVDAASAQPESYAKLRLLYDTEPPANITWEGSDVAGKELARKTIEENNQKCVWVKFKHTQYKLTVQNARDQHPDVKVFDRVDHDGTHLASVANGATVELECIRADGDDDGYARVHLSNLDDSLIKWDGQDDAGKKHAREVIAKQNGTVFVKAKHLTLLPRLRRVVKNAETRHDNVKVYESKDSAFQRRFSATITNWLDVELVDVVCSESDTEPYVQVRIPDSSDKIRWERPEAMCNIVWIKRKHLQGPTATGR